MDTPLVLILLLVVIIFAGQQAGVWDVGQITSTVEGAVLGNLSASQIAAYASAAGFSGNDLATAVAIALAESGGNTNAYNPETAAGAPSGQGSFGLWQIYLNAHPEFDGWNLYDPQQNANAAYEIYAAAGNSFSPWSTYNGGQYQSYLSEAMDAVNA